jgi:hypothetical protein
VNRRRVVQCSLGNVGSLNLPLLLDRPELELVGVWCHAPEKHGRDVGPLVGRDPVGLRVASTFDEIVAVEADCALYHSQILEREDDAIAEIARLLRSGKNVVVPWISALQWPPFGRVFAPRAVAEVEAACADGGTSLLMTGTDPGFFSDMLPVVLTGVCGTVESIRIQEILDYSPFDDPRLTAPDFLCFGRPLEHADANFVGDHTIEQGWGATAALTAAALGFEVVGSSTFERRAPATRRLDFEHAGPVEPGTIGARWFGITVTTDGPTVTWEHITHVDADCIPPEWPVDRPVGNGYVVKIEGSPTLRLQCEVSAQGSHFWGAYLVTATRCTNVIDAVCRAQPGICTVFDLALGDVTLARPPGRAR